MNFAIRRDWLLSICLAVTIAVIGTARLTAQAPGATVTGVDAKTGVVTAKVNSTGQIFTFTLANKAQLNGVHTGQSVYVNLGKKQVSLTGKQPDGTIASIIPPGGARGSAAPTDGGKGGACCSITTINTSNGVGQAKIDANSEGFVFQLSDASQAKNLKIGQHVYANFATKQMSLDGKNPAGTIIQGPSSGNRYDSSGNAKE